MTSRPSRSATLFVATAFGVLGALLSAGCGEDGVTPTCPPIRLYDVRDPDVLDDPDVADDRRAAIAAKCITDVGNAEPLNEDAGSD